MSKMIAGVRVIAVKPTDVTRNPWNPNRMSEETFAKEILSIKNNGFIDPIKVRELEDGSLEIVDGEHRWKAAKEIGLKEIPAINLGPIGDEQAKKLTIIANELRGAPEPVLLAALLKDLSLTIDASQLAMELPMTQVEIDSLIKSTTEFNWDAIQEGLTTDETERADPDSDRPTAPVSFNIGAERRFQLGVTRANIPAKLCDALNLEWDRSAAAIGSKNPELVMRHWLERLRTTAEEANEAARANMPPAPPAKPAATKKAKKKGAKAA